jgi:hypothetical protein
MLTMLGDDAFTFCGFLAKVDPTMSDEQKAMADVINKMFEITPSSGVELDEALVQGMLAQLVAGGVVSQATKDSIDAWVADKLSEPEAYPEKTYTLDKVVSGSEYDTHWIRANAVPLGVDLATTDYGTYWEVILNGALPSPAVEVTA